MRMQMSESKTSGLLLTLFGLNRTGQMLWALVFVLGIAGFVYWTMMPGLRFSDEDERLFHAARHGDRSGVEASLRAGAGVGDVSPIDGKTALFRAAVFGHVEVVRFLIDQGADLETRGLDGKTALDLVRAAQEAERNSERQRSLAAVAAVLTTASKDAR
jgi:hypothetical protein